MFLQCGNTLRLGLKLHHLRAFSAALHLQHDVATLVAEQGRTTPALRHRDDHLADEQGIRMRAGPPTGPDQIRAGN